jgi:antirestriction protein ArdC
VVKGEDEERSIISMLRTYSVFNVAQIEGLPEPEAPKPVNVEHEAQSFIKATSADIRHGGDRACFVPSKDFINLPEVWQFRDVDSYFATALHELGHWSGAKSRLDRDLSGRFRTRSYAAEELIAELAAAFLCAHLGIKGELRHAGYVQDWISLLKDDRRAIFTAASKASQAADYLRGFSERIEEAA